MRNKKDLFHIHTYRCNHAGTEKEWEYVEKAIDLETDVITFTDHAPFPGNPFLNRMDIEELPEYIETLENLRLRYQKHIQIRIGLEIEYLPSFYSYYQKLKAMNKFDVLMIGQHFYEVEPRIYNFSDKELQKNERFGLANAICEGANTGLFDVIAHPDRVFRRCEAWNMENEKLSNKIIQAAIKNNVLLEINRSSQKKINQF